MAKKAKIKVVYKRGVFREIRTLPEVMAILHSEADGIAARAGEGYSASSGVTGGRGRGRASVVTTNASAVRDNAKNHTLVRAFGGRRR